MTLEAHFLALALTMLVWALLDRAGLSGWPRSRRLFILAGAICALPILLVALLGADESWITGKEGLFEALTEGTLLFLVLRAGHRRSWWVFAGALFLLLEELDYGQWLLGFETPALLAEMGSRSSQANIHNITTIDLLVRVLPLAALVLLSLRDRLPAAAAPAMARMRLPRLHRDAWWGALAALLAAWPTMTLAGEPRSDESCELALVLVVALAWTARPASAERGLKAPG